MASLGLLQYRSANDLRADEEAEAQQIRDEQERRRQLVESSLGERDQPSGSWWSNRRPFTFRWLVTSTVRVRSASFKW